MRNLLLICSLFLLFLQAKSQQSELVSLTTKDRIFSGMIDDSYPITMYLKVEQRSKNNGFIQSVTGWYSYDKVGTPIPLAGLIGSGGSGMHLVTSSDQKVLDGITNFEYDADEEVIALDSRITEIEQNMSRVNHISERFKLDYEGDKILGSWQGNDKSLKVELFADEYRVSNTQHFIRHPNGDYFDLAFLGLPDWATISVEANANKGKNIILDYYFQANLNYMGRCGAAENKGKVALIFNESYELMKSSFVIFEDCYRDTYILEEKKISDPITEYKIEQFENSDDPQYVTWIVDLQKATLTNK